jgi:hypothetical protein
MVLGLVGSVRVIGVMIGLGLAAACARGTLSEDELDVSDASGGQGGLGGASSASSADASTTASSTGSSIGGSSSAGGAGGEGGCGPQEHLCSGTCQGNTPATGCYQSSSCTPCPPVANGTSSCTTDGLCDFTCTPPFQKSGNTCACLSQCCSNQDCASPTSCQNGQCACDSGLCQSYCVSMFCVGGCVLNQCECLCP